MKVGSSPIAPQSLHRTLAIAALCRDVWRATRPALSRRSSCGKHGLTVRGEIGGIHLALGEVVISNEHTWELWRARRVAVFVDTPVGRLTRGASMTSAEYA